MTRTAILLLLLASTLIGQDGALRLTMKRAVELALSAEGSPKLQLVRESVIQARSRSAEAKAALLPNLEVSAGAQNLSRNLAVLGLTSSTLGFPVPSRVGPLNVVDARTSGSQTIFDLSSIYRYRASKIGIRNAQEGVQAAEESIASDVTRAYIDALRAVARVRAAQANLELAESVLKASENSRRAGTASGLEVSRARLRVAQQRQELLQAGNEKRQAELLLRRRIGLRLDVQLELADHLARPPAADGVAGLAASALASRPDWKAQLEREAESGLAARAARAERMPSVQAFADYGATGSGPMSALATHTAGLAVSVPLFDGGRRRAHAEQSASLWRQEKVRTADLRDQIRYELEVAVDRLHSSLAESDLAEQALQIAERTFEQAERRYRNGAADHLLVAEAQNEVAQARENQITALYGANLAWAGVQSAAGRLTTELGVR